MKFTVDLFASAGILLFLDQWSKALAETHATSRLVSWGRLVRIRPVKNLRGIYRRDSVQAAMVLLWFVSLASAAALYRFGSRFQSHAALIGLGLAFGGAAGNLLDILRSRSVRDFIQVPHWRVFNLADAAITGGLCLAFWIGS
jgi:signal peptidase II